MIIIKHPKYTEAEEKRFNLLSFSNYPDAAEIATSFVDTLYDFGYMTKASINLEKREIYLKYIRPRIGNYKKMLKIPRVTFEVKLAKKLDARLNRVKGLQDFTWRVV